MKKKGLIISTIVMVVVLIACLSTATYAWFSSTAQATIENISIQTVATAGLQVGVETAADGMDSGWANGTLTWENGNFSGTDGWGSLVDFSDVSATDKLGGLDTAVKPYNTEIVHALVDAPVYASIADYWVTGNDAMVAADAIYTTEALFDTAVAEGTRFYSVVENPTYAYVKPIAYTADIEPIGWQAAGENDDYMELPIGVRATADMQYIFCSVKVTAKQMDMSSTAYMPGMAAASRIVLTTATGNTTVEPFASVTTGASGLIWDNTAEFTYNFVVARGAIKALDVFLINYTIYILGTDGQCIQLTAGSGFDINIDYSFSELGDGVTADANKVTLNSVDYAIVENITTEKV